MTIVPLLIEDTTVYVEVDETAVITSPQKGGEGQLEGVKDRLEAAVKNIDELGTTILAVCRGIHQKAYAAMGEVKPKEFEVEFGITLGGEAGIPFVTKGKGDAQFKIRGTWVS